jgi:hypothetical protein
MKIIFDWLLNWHKFTKNIHHPWSSETTCGKVQFHPRNQIVGSSLSIIKPTTHSVKTCSWMQIPKAEPPAVLLTCRKVFFTARLGRASTKRPTRSRSTYCSLQLRSYQNHPNRLTYVFFYLPGEVPTALMGRWPQRYRTLQRLITQFENFSISPRNFKVHLFPQHSWGKRCSAFRQICKAVGNGFISLAMFVCLSVCLSALNGATLSGKFFIKFLMSDTD